MDEFKRVLERRADSLILKVLKIRHEHANRKKQCDCYVCR